MKTSVVVVDSHPLVRHGLSLAFARNQDIDLVRVCADDRSLWAAVAEHEPDVVVTAARLSPGFGVEGIDIAQAMRRLNPRTGVVVVSGASNPEYVTALLAGGAAGRAYLMRERLVDRQMLIDVVHLVAAGMTIIDPAVDVGTDYGFAGFDNGRSVSASGPGQAHTVGSSTDRGVTLQR